MPNLGGLARTCEIFQAKSMVLSDKKILKDKQFQNVSVTAENWLEFDEVSVPEAKEHEDGIVGGSEDYGAVERKFSEWKRKGYTIVALEQTSNSSVLSNYAFPEKVVLVLGREKQGIPVEVLQLVDVALEIPQLGLLRSLNVHVSAALCLWEYTRQRLVKKSLK
jgi:tRNA guanosine-2'-O-methyltransferase